LEAVLVEELLERADVLAAVVELSIMGKGKGSTGGRGLSSMWRRRGYCKGENN